MSCYSTKTTPTHSTTTPQLRTLRNPKEETFELVSHRQFTCVVFPVLNAKKCIKTFSFFLRLDISEKSYPKSQCWKITQKYSIRFLFYCSTIAGNIEYLNVNMGLLRCFSNTVKNSFFKKAFFFFVLFLFLFFCALCEKKKKR